MSDLGKVFMSSVREVKIVKVYVLKSYLSLICLMQFLVARELFWDDFLFLKLEKALH